MTPFRKEFKIHGQVDAERGFPFVSLVRQFETCLKKGFTNVELTDAVIRAVLAGGMRCYLEGKRISATDSTGSLQGEVSNRTIF